MIGMETEPMVGLVMVVCSVVIMFRAYYTYSKRLRMIKSDDYSLPFYDKYNPHFLMILFVCPAVVFIIRHGISIAKTLS